MRANARHVKARRMWCISFAMRNSRDAARSRKFFERLNARIAQLGGSTEGIAQGIERELLSLTLHGSARVG